MSSDVQNAGTPPGHKRCPDCQQTKPAEAFSRNAAQPDGLQFYCKPCYSARAARTYRERQARKGKEVRERIATPSGFKRCPGCGEIKPHSEWHRNARTYDGLASRCKPCRSAESRQSHLRRSFGLTVEAWHALIERQGGGCAICRDGRPKHVDHDHETGAVRGVLCGPCNMGLGQFGNDPRRLVAAAVYLERHRPVRRFGIQEVQNDGCCVVDLSDYRHRAA